MYSSIIGQYALPNFISFIITSVNFIFPFLLAFFLSVFISCLSICLLQTMHYKHSVHVMSTVQLTSIFICDRNGPSDIYSRKQASSTEQRDMKFSIVLTQRNCMIIWVKQEKWLLLISDTLWNGLISPWPRLRYRRWLSHKLRLLPLCNKYREWLEKESYVAFTQNKV